MRALRFAVTAAACLAVVVPFSLLVALAEWREQPRRRDQWREPAHV